MVTALNRRYAKSLLALAVDMQKVDEVKKDMDLVSATVNASRDLAVLLKSPVVKEDKKTAIIKGVFEGKVGDLTLKFLLILVSKGRESQLEGMAEGFQNLYRAHNGIQQASITTAASLGDAQRTDISAKLKEVIGSNIELKEIIDPSIIGGIKIRVGDRQYNGSLAYQLQQLKRQFESNQYVADF